MSATTAEATTAIDHEVIGALDVLRRAHDLPKLVSVFTEAGVGEATGYRRIKEPGDLKLEELVAITQRFRVPLHILTAGELATLRYVKTGAEEAGPDDGPGLPVGTPPGTRTRNLRNKREAQVLTFPAPHPTPLPTAA